MFRTRLLPVVLSLIGGIFILTAIVLVTTGQDQSEEVPPAVDTDVPTNIVNQKPLPSTLSGLVKNEDGAVVDAIVQIQATDITTRTDVAGAFEFTDLEQNAPAVVSAWAEGHYVGWQVLDPTAPEWTGADSIIIMLNPLPVRDNSEYEGFIEDGVRGSDACGMCHREYPEWQADAHSQTATNPRFLSVYTGTNLAGDPGQVVQYDIDGNPQPHDPDEPYFGAGFRLDNPSSSGNCASCHTPTASTSPNKQNCAWSGCHSDTTIQRAAGVIDSNAYPTSLRAKDSISCEFCHKIGEVYLNDDNLPNPDMPGILSYRLFRPNNAENDVMFGTMIDVMRQDSYLPLLSESEFCAGCHMGTFGGIVGMERVSDGTVVYSSYGEWQASSYADPETGQTCQDCHMPISPENWFVKPEKGGLTRDYMPLHNHKMRGVTDEEFLQNAVSMETTATRDGDEVQIEVSITNDNTGHHIPTDAPIRSMILVVEVTDADGNVLDLITGSVNPDYSGDYAGTAGKTFAKVLTDELTGETPTVAFWRPVTIAEDTRIPAHETDTTTYTFNAPDDVNITVKLLFRRAFYELMQQKGWEDPDIVMKQETIQLPVN